MATEAHDERALWIRESETLGPRARPDVLHLVDVVTELDPEELLDRSSVTHRVSSLATRGAPGSAIDDKYDKITWVLARHDRLTPSYDKGERPNEHPRRSSCGQR